MSTATRRGLRPRLRVLRRVLSDRPTRRRRRLPRLGPRLLGVLLVVAALLAGAYFWVRGSSLVAVQRVRVTGVSGPDATVIRQALVQSAERMTTMNIDSRRLKAAVARYPVVRSLRVSTHLPHSATIAVFEQVPVAVLGGTVVSSRGTLLRSVSPSNEMLPTITASSGAASGAVGSDAVSGTARADVALLAAAPYPIIARLASAGWKPGRGLTAELRNGPVIFFGDDTRFAAKWRSVIDVLADASSAGASYIDVTDPDRPAAGTGSDTSSTEPTGSATTPSSTTAQTATSIGDTATT